MVKVLALADIHGDKALVQKASEIAVKEKVDLVVLAGDLTYSGEGLEGLLKPLLEKGLEVAVIHGNHEDESTIEFISQLYGVINLHGNYVVKDDVVIFGAGGAEIGPFLTPEDEIYKALFSVYKKLKKAKKKVMVTHVHPSNSTFENILSFFPGSRAVENAIKKLKPDLAICGHIHEARGLEDLVHGTKVVNVSRTPRVFEL